MESAVAEDSKSVRRRTPATLPLGIELNDNRYGDGASQGASADQALRSLRCRSSHRLVWVLRSANAAIAGSTARAG